MTGAELSPVTLPAGTAWGGGLAILRFGAAAAFGTPADYFAPADWETLTTEDQSFRTAPVVFDLPNSMPGQRAIAFGKDGMAYLLDRTHLGGIGSAVGADSDAAIGTSP
ncbi:MAG: hypothetical protein ABSF69_29540 [Polyangiaceae bacterium]|jgi:hypothetical protein